VDPCSGVAGPVVSCTADVLPTAALEVPCATAVLPWTPVELPCIADELLWDCVVATAESVVTTLDAVAVIAVVAGALDACLAW
jgi:hypothetical protein